MISNFLFFVALIALQLASIVLTLNLREKIMSALDDLTTAIDQETNAVAARIDKLTGELAAAVAAGQAPTAAQIAALQAVSDRLKTLGADPAAPIPPAPAPQPSPFTKP